MIDFLLWGGAAGKAALILAAVLLLGSCGGIVGRLARLQEYSDAGLMTSRDGVPIRWRAGGFLPILPLTMWVSDDLHPAYFAIAKQVNAELGEVIGRKPFLFLHSGDVRLEANRLLQGHLSLSDDGGSNPDEACTTYILNDDDSLKAAAIVVPEFHVVDEGVARAIVLHEFGHALGLDHDDDPGSIMYPKITGMPQVLSKSDKKLLKKLYS